MCVSTAEEIEEARALLDSRVRVVCIRSNDAWMRDIGPVFITNDLGDVSGWLSAMQMLHSMGRAAAAPQLLGLRRGIARSTVVRVVQASMYRAQWVGMGPHGTECKCAVDTCFCS